MQFTSEDLKLIRMCLTLKFLTCWNRGINPKQIGIPQDKGDILFIENNAVLLMGNAQQSTHWNHHMKINHFVLLDLVEHDLLSITYINTSDYCVDAITKAMGHNYIIDILMIFKEKNTQTCDSLCSTQPILLHKQYYHNIIYVLSKEHGVRVYVFVCVSYVCMYAYAMLCTQVNFTYIIHYNYCFIYRANTARTISQRIIILFLQEYKFFDNASAKNWKTLLPVRYRNVQYQIGYGTGYQVQVFSNRDQKSHFMYIIIPFCTRTRLTFSDVQ